MNKRTRAVDEETYIKIISTIKQGFLHEGVRHKPNVRIATILVLEYNLGLRISDVLLLTVNSFAKDGDRYHLDHYEKKTGKLFFKLVANSSPVTSIIKRVEKTLINSMFSLFGSFFFCRIGKRTCKECRRRQK